MILKRTKNMHLQDLYHVIHTLITSIDWHLEYLTSPCHLFICSEMLYTISVHWMSQRNVACMIFEVKFFVVF